MTLPFRPSLEQQFNDWLASCPEVWSIFVRVAWEVKAAGFTRYSADALCHRIRWHFNVERRDADFKLNNNYVSRLARKLMDEHAEFAGFFEVRRLTA